MSKDRLRTSAGFVLLLSFFPACFYDTKEPLAQELEEKIVLPSPNSLIEAYAERIKKAFMHRGDVIAKILGVLTTDQSSLTWTEISRLIDSADSSQKTELDRIVRSFEEAIEVAPLDYTLALTLPYVEKVAENLLLVNGDTLVPVNSLRGIQETLVLNTLALKKDPGELTETVVAKLKDAFPKRRSRRRSKRGIFQASTVAWPGDVVYYRWNNILEKPAKGCTLSHKQALEQAMADWTAHTDVMFQELPDKKDVNRKLDLGVIGVVELESKNPRKRDPSVSGVATVGYYANRTGRYHKGSSGYLRMRPDIDTDEELIHTARHELGHILGLIHEHERYDRNEYVLLYDSSEAPVPLFKQVWVYWRIPYDILGVRIYLYRLELINTNERASYVGGSFDFLSVMLYGGLLVPQSKIDAKGIEISYLDERDGQYYTRDNSDISEQDADTVKRLYDL